MLCKSEKVTADVFWLVCQSFKAVMLKQSNATRETLQTVFAVTDRVMIRPCVMDMWQGSLGPEGLALGVGFSHNGVLNYLYSHTAGH